MLLIALRKGGAKCSSACPFYEESGVVRGINGPLKTHCSMTMNPWMADCDIYNPLCIDKLEVTEAQWRKMQAAVGLKAIRQRKQYPDEHDEIHAVGCEWTRRRASAGEQPFGSKGKHNADKSANVPPRHLFPCRIKEDLSLNH